MAESVKSTIAPLQPAYSPLGREFPQVGNPCFKLSDGGGRWVGISFPQIFTSNQIMSDVRDKIFN